MLARHRQRLCRPPAIWPRRSGPTLRAFFQPPRKGERRREEDSGGRAASVEAACRPDLATATGGDRQSRGPSSIGGPCPSVAARLEARRREACPPPPVAGPLLASNCATRPPGSDLPPAGEDGPWRPCRWEVDGDGEKARPRGSWRRGWAPPHPSLAARHARRWSLRRCLPAVLPDAFIPTAEVGEAHAAGAEEVSRLRLLPSRRISGRRSACSRPGGPAARSRGRCLPGTFAAAQEIRCCLCSMGGALGASALHHLCLHRPAPPATSTSSPAAAATSLPAGRCIEPRKIRA
ncbi:unnamed protein product [Urochloa humidicola]